MRKPIGRNGRSRLSTVASVTLCLVAGAGGCGSDHGREGAKVEALGAAQAALSVAIAPATLAFEFDLEGQHIELALERARPPTAAGYQSFRRTEDGQLVALPPPDLSCTYRGVTEVIGAASGTTPGFAAMSVCASATQHAAGHAARGVIRVNGSLWRLTPDAADQDASDGIDHLAEPMRRPDASGRVGTVARRVTLQRLAASVAPRLAFREGTDEETKYIDLIVVNDAERVAELGDDTEASTLEFVDTMNALLEGSGLVPRLRVTLRSQVLFQQDPYVPDFQNGDQADHVTLLERFLDWGAAEDLPAHDERMLLSGYDFLGGVVGYAGLGVACTTSSNGYIVQAGGDSGGFAVLSAVHELGHTLGMNHDTGSDACPESGFIMAAVGCGNCPGAEQADFSPCSIDEFQGFLAGPAYSGTHCADDVPSGSRPSCGDGAVQDGETCDCGSDDCSDIDPCCDGATCQLEGDAECSDFNDGCCRNCQIIGADEPVVCRAALSSCDIAESCTGSSKECPADSFRSANGECLDERGNPGACYFGDCRSRATQCEELAEQDDRPQFDNVGAPAPGCGTPCNAVMCGTGPRNCLTIGGADLIDGVPCENGGQCVDGQCVATVDQCPGDPEKEDPGVCGCGTADGDSDNDGSPDCEDRCDDDADKQAPGVCGCGTPDADGDGDGAPDCADECPSDASKSDAGDCGCGQAEADSDSDGAADCVDECPQHSLERTPGACGCGVPEIDTDFDGTPDCLDACLTDGARTAPPCTLLNGIDSDGDGDVDMPLVRGSVKAKGSCAIAPAGSEPRAPGVLVALGALALAGLARLRRRPG